MKKHMFYVEFQSQDGCSKVRLRRRMQIRCPPGGIYAWPDWQRRMSLEQCEYLTGAMQISCWSHAGTHWTQATIAA